MATIDDLIKLKTQQINNLKALKLVEAIEKKQYLVVRVIKVNKYPSCDQYQLIKVDENKPILLDKLTRIKSYLRLRNITSYTVVKNMNNSNLILK
jgi:hypothetical protein